MAAKSSPKRARRRPGRPRADERIPEGSRERVLDAAAEVFARRGYERATVDEIAGEAGLSKGTVYWNFASKEDLFVALLEERIDRPTRGLMEMSRATPLDQPSAGAVDAGLTAMVRERPELFQLVIEYWAAAARDPKLRKRYVARQQDLRETLAEVMRARQPDDIPFLVPPEALATAFIALAFGLAQELVVDPDSVSEGLFGEILSLCYDGNAARAGRLPSD
jgi:AcrR family transcriptional regulator